MICISFHVFSFIPKNTNLVFQFRVYRELLTNFCMSEFGTYLAKREKKEPDLIKILTVFTIDG